VPLFTRVIPWSRLAKGQRSRFYLNTRICRKIELQIGGYATGNGNVQIKDVRAIYDDVMV
jgi:hypothetical protein